MVEGKSADRLRLGCSDVILRAGAHAGFSRYEATLRAHVFGALVQLASSIVQCYHSDLYHDAAWLSEHLTGPMSFYFGVRTSGTHIGTDHALIGPASDKTYRIELLREGGEWSIVVERSDGGA